MVRACAGSRVEGVNIAQTPGRAASVQNAVVEDHGAAFWDATGDHIQ